MKIQKWDKQGDIFKGALDPIYRDLDHCDVYYVESKAFAVLNHRPKYAPYLRAGILEIQDIFVLHDYRQQGLATALINHCEAITNGDVIGISVPVSPRFGAAQRLYYKLGYMPDGNGVTYDRQMLDHNSRVQLNDDLCLMMVKELCKVTKPK
jgi:GNAT superfamily N-acetyltransferase